MLDVSVFYIKVENRNKTTVCGANIGFTFLYVVCALVLGIQNTKKKLLSASWRKQSRKNIYNFDPSTKLDCSMCNFFSFKYDSHWFTILLQHWQYTQRPNLKIPSANRLPWRSLTLNIHPYNIILYTHTWNDEQFYWLTAQNVLVKRMLLAHTNFQ